MEMYRQDCKENNMLQEVTEQNDFYSPVKSNKSDFSESEAPHQSQIFEPVEAVDSAGVPYECGTTAANANIPKFGKVIPDRVFIGGIDFKTKEEDLEKYFSSFGRITHTKVVRDRAEVSKGFGFVTFETVEEANRVRKQEDCLYLNGKKLNIGPAIEKHQTSFPKDIHMPGPPGSWVLHPRGYASYTHQNGITYFPPAITMPISLSCQPQALSQNSMAAYNSNAVSYPTLPQYSAHAYPSCDNTLHAACRAPVPGTCGQIIAAPIQHSGTGPVNIVPVPPSIAPSYIVPHSLPSNPQVVQPIDITPQGGVVEQTNKPLYSAPPSESIRMVVPAPGYIHPPMRNPLLRSVPPAALLAPSDPLRFAPMQYIGISDNPVPPAGYCDVISVAEVSMTSENNILTPPLTPDQLNKQ